MQWNELGIKNRNCFTGEAEAAVCFMLCICLRQNNGFTAKTTTLGEYLGSRDVEGGWGVERRKKERDGGGGEGRRTDKTEMGE